MAEEPSLPLNKCHRDCLNNIKIGLWGDNEAPNFDVGQFVSYIKEVKVYTGNVVNGLKINYVDIDGQKQTFRAGSLVGESEGFQLKADECINRVGGFFKGYDDKMCISQLEFRTDRENKYGPYGPGGGQKFTVKVTDGRIIGFYGLAECHINSIGFYLGGVGENVDVNLN